MSHLQRSASGEQTSSSDNGGWNVDIAALLKKYDIRLTLLEE